MEDVTETSEATTNEVPQAVTDAFAGVFGGGNTAAEAATEDGGEAGEGSSALRPGMNGTQEEQEELEQEGLEGPDAGEGEAGDHTETPEPSDGEDKPAAKPGETPAAAADKPKLDPFLRFAAEEAGLSGDKIDKFYAADPEAATAMFQTLADQYTNLSRQFVQAPGSPVAPGTQAAPTTAAQPDSSPTPNLDKFFADLSSFAEGNGQEMADFAKLLNDEVVGPLKSMIAANRVQEQRLLAQEATSAFATVRKDFDAFYGPDNGSLTTEQTKARNDLAALADQIRAGAKAQGRDVSVTDAIKRAHAMVTADYRSAEARKAVVKQVEKRSKQITAKPTQRRSPAQAAGSKSDDAATNAYREKALALGLELDD